jgi:hypothetical protein
MALPFFNPLFDMLPDGGIYDPESGLSYVGPGARLPGGQDPDTFLVPTSPTPASVAEANRLLQGTGLTAPITGEGSNASAIGTENPTRTNTFVSGRTEPVYQATDGKEFTNKTEYITHQNKLNNPTNTNPSGTVITPTVTSPVVTTNPPPAGGVSNRNAREFLLGSLRQYFSRPEDAGFLKDLEKIIDGYLVEEYDEDTISVLLPQTEPFKQRFKGNEARIAAGLDALKPSDYLLAENQYNEILKRFNLGDLATRDTFATLVGGQVSAAELTDRVVNVYDRIRNADPALRAEIDRVEALSRGQLSDADFARALLTGSEGANELKRKISVAEITAEARQRGLGVSRAEQLQQVGVTREQAREGFERIALTQPTLEKLSDIYRRDLAPETTDARAARTTELQTELESEQFLGMQSERRRRLTEQEQTAFMGQSGTQRLGIARRPRRSQF